MANVLESNESDRTARISALRRPLVIGVVVIGAVFLLTMWSMTHKRATANAADEREEKPVEEQLYVPATERAEKMLEAQTDAVVVQQAREEQVAAQAQAREAALQQQLESTQAGRGPAAPPRAASDKYAEARAAMIAEDKLKAFESELLLRREAFAAGTRLKAVERAKETALHDAQSLSQGAGLNGDDIGMQGLQQLTSMMGQGLSARSLGGGPGEPPMAMAAVDRQALERDPNKNADKIDFFKNGGTHLRPGELENEMQDPKTPYELLMGESIPCTLLTKIVSAVPGIITCQVSRDVKDTATGDHTLIPWGAVGVGMYNVQVTAANSARVQVVWTRINFPNGQRLDLGSMPGSDSEGVAGVADKIDRHIAARFGAAVLASMFTVAVEVTAPQNGNFYGSAINRGLGEGALNFGTELARELGERPPTITIRQGAPLLISVNKDIVFRAPYSSKLPSQGRAR